MDAKLNKEVADLLREITWNFGSQGMDGQCCDNLSAPEMRALRSAFSCKNSSMQAMAKALGFTKSGATRVVDRLEQKGMVQREKHSEDGRVCCVNITKPGQEMIARFNQDAEQRVEQVLQNMDPGMQQVLLASLKAFVDAI